MRGPPRARAGCLELPIPYTLYLIRRVSIPYTLYIGTGRVSGIASAAQLAERGLGKAAAAGTVTQCFAKCPFPCQFDWLSDQLCPSLDWLSDQLCPSLDWLSGHFAKHWAGWLAGGSPKGARGTQAQRESAELRSPARSRLQWRCPCTTRVASG